MTMQLATEPDHSEGRAEQQRHEYRAHHAEDENAG